MNLKQTQEGYDGIYLERSGKDALTLTEILIAQPEFPLNEAQKEEIHEFDNSIYSYQLEVGMTLGDAVRGHKGERTMAPRFFAEAFLQGKVDTTKLGDIVPAFSSSEDVYKWLAISARDSIVDEVTLLKMAKESSNYYKETTANLLINGQDPNAEDINSMPIVVNPQATIKSALAVVQSRTFLHDLHNLYKEGGDRVDGAKRALTDVYLSKVNTLVVSDFITIDYLINQAKLIGDEKEEEVAESLIPKVILIALDSFKFKTIKRFDFFMNGIGRDKDGNATVVDDLVLNENELQEPNVELAAKCEKIKSYMLKPQEMIDIYSRILDDAGLLSSEDSRSWSPRRKQRAADNLFQVVMNPTAKTFAVDGISGVYKVPSDDRSLFDVITTGGFHEFEHINQTQTDLELGKSIKVAELKGKRVSMLRESGANFKQREAECELFGECKPVSFAYAKALQIIENGGDVFDATRAFYNEKLRTNPNADPLLLAREAADRVLRLTLQGGINSQAMSYAEENILNQELRIASPEIKARAITVTSLDLVDQVRLHKYDLLPLPKNGSIDWTKNIMKEVEPYIAKALLLNFE